MKTLLLALILLAPQEGPQAPPPTPPKTAWVVIFNHFGGEKPHPITVNVRLIVWAGSEGEAALVAMKKMRSVMDEGFCDALQFVEAQAK